LKSTEKSLQQGMRIVFVIPYFYPALEYGGTPRLAYEVARALTRRGHKVKVLTTDSGGSSRIAGDVIRSIHENSLDGIQVRYYRNLSNHLAYRHRLFFPPQFFFDVRQHVVESDIVHIHDLRSFLTVAAHSALRAANKPYVLSPHGGLRHLGKKSAKTVFDTLWGQAILRDAGALCAISPVEERDAIAFGIDKRRIYRFPSAINAELYRDLPPPGEFGSRRGLAGRQIILFLGRLHWVKGVDILIEALGLLKDVPDVHLVVAGPDDGAESRLRSLVKKKALTGKVTFTGFLDQAQKTQALMDSRLVVVPSRSEAFALALLEGLACERPVLVSSACEMRDWMPPLAGWSTFRSEDAGDLARQLRTTLREAPDEKSLLEARTLVLTEFSADALAARAEALYESLIGVRGERGLKPSFNIRG
jgi:glycosyltransferase involved in cell wall biosynthesis